MTPAFSAFVCEACVTLYFHGWNSSLIFRFTTMSFSTFHVVKTTRISFLKVEGPNPQINKWIQCIVPSLLQLFHLRALGVLLLCSSPGDSTQGLSLGFYALFPFNPVQGAFGLDVVFGCFSFVYFVLFHF